MVTSGKNTMELIIAARDRTGKAFATVNSRMGRLNDVSKKVTGALKTTAKAGALIGGAAVVAGIVGSTKAFMDFEDAMANVRKTTGLSKEQITVMGKAIDNLALKIPVAQTELAAIAATAGQLGIIGQKNILGFTDTVAKMTTAFDMAANDVAIAMAKLTNIYDIPIAQVGNLGSAINVLGNTTAASESQLMAFSMSLGPTGNQLGFTATEALSLGASMVSIGMDASNAGTRLSRAFSMIGQNLGELASFMGVTTEEFTASFEEMPMETFMGVLEKLSQVEGKLKANTVASELFNEIGAKAIKGLTGNLDGLRTNLKSSEEGFKANVSLEEEFAAKTDTLKARFQLLKNSISSLLIDIGGELAPSLNQIIDGVRNIIPPLKDLIFEIGAGFGEMFESVSRQAGPALDPLIKKLKEAGDKIGAGLNFKTLLDDIGVFIGAGLNPLIRGFTWLIDKLGPLWELIGKGATLFHDLANALKTEEGRIDDILDATENLTKAKQDLFDINEKLRGNVETLASALEKAGGWTTALADLEADAKIKTDALTVAQKAATEAIVTYGADSEIAKTAIENVKTAEEAATSATNSFNTAVGIASQAIIDEGVATEDLEQAQIDFTTSTEDAIEGQENLVTAVADVETELEEAKAAPFKLGEAFEDFGKLVARIFLAIPLKIAEAILSTQEIISGGLAKIGLGGLGEKLEADTEHIKEKIASIKESLITNIEEPLSEDIPAASEEMEKAVTGGLDAINSPAKRVKEGIEDINTVLEDTEGIATDTGEAGEDAFEKIKIIVDKVTGNVEVLTDNLKETADSFKDNEEAAKTLLNLDWEVFSKLEMNLPDINEGIGDMSSAFEGLEIVLMDNLENLEKLKGAVEGIGRLTSPFLEEGFMGGIKSIGEFGNILKDAGSAIDTFSSLQEVSIDGMINFSLHVRDMVSALQILESQMEDLVPAFGEMDLLITNIADSFLYGGKKIDTFVSGFKTKMETVYSIANDAEMPFKAFKETVEDAFSPEGFKYWKVFDWDEMSMGWSTAVVEDVFDVTRAFNDATKSAEGFSRLYTHPERLAPFFTESAETIQSWAKTIYGLKIPIEEINGIIAGSYEEQAEWITNLLTQNETLDNAFEQSASQLRIWSKETYGVSMSSQEAYDVMAMSEEEQLVWLDKLMHSNTALTFQMDKQTNALAAQTGQLSKITDALAPYLNFMRTLNEIAVLSTLSTEELNSGLNSIKDTLINLGDALTTFDIGPVMESLFGTKILEGEDLASSFTGGLTTGFTDTMLKYQTPFNNLIKYVERLSAALSSLVMSFKALEDVGDSILVNPIKLKEVFENILDVMTNFGTEMGGIEGFSKKFATGIDTMIKSADPLIVYFQDNNAAVDRFNGTLTTFRNTLLNVIETMELLKNVSEMTMPSVEEMGAGFDAANKFVKDFDEALMGHIGVREGQWDMEKYYNSIFKSIENFAKDWDALSANVKDSFETFNTASSTITGMINNVLSLSTAFTTLGNSTVASAKDMERAMRNLDVFIGRFTEVMASGLALVVGDLKALDIEWKKYSEDMKELMPSFKSATSDISTLINTVTSLNSAFKTLSETSVTSSVNFDKGFSALIETVSNFATSLGNNIGPLIESLQKLQRVWLENEDVLFPLMEDFGIIVYNLKGMADAANTMTASFERLNKGWVMLERGFDRLVKFIKTTIEAVKEFYTPEAAAEVSTFIDDIGLVIDSFTELNGKIESALNDIKSKIATSVETIETKIKSLENLNSTMFDAGQNLISSLINGMDSMKEDLGRAAAELAETIEDHLGVESPTKKGPLMNLEEWPKNLVRSFSKGIETEMDGLNVSLGTMVAPPIMSGGVEGGNRTSVTFHVTQNIKDRTTADYSTQELEKLLRRHIPD